MQSNSPLHLPHIRNITVSGRIGSGQTTLAVSLAEILHWELLEGGEIFQQFDDERQASENEVDTRPDMLDLAYEEKVKKILTQKEHVIVQSHLAGFDAWEIGGVYRILVVCEDKEGRDKQEIRIDRLVNRKGITVEKAKEEVVLREEGNLRKWRRLYMHNDQNWVYWEKKYYNLIVNTYSHNKEESVKVVLDQILKDKKTDNS